MDPKKKKRLAKWVGYPAFFCAALVAMLYATFPYELLGTLVKAEAKKAKVELTFDSLRPTLTGVRANGVQLTLPKDSGGEPEPIVIDSVTARPSLFPLGAALTAKAFGGTVDVGLGMLGKRPPISVKAEGLQVMRANLKGAIGLDLDGALSASADLEVDPKDHSKTTGTIKLSAQQLVVRGGTVVQYDLPKIDLGDVEAEIEAKDGKATIKNFKGNGKDVELNIEGEAQLQPKFLFSNTTLKIGFTPSEDFLKRNSIIQTGLTFGSQGGPLTRNGNGYSVKMSGVLGRLRPTK